MTNREYINSLTNERLADFFYQKAFPTVIIARLETIAIMILTFLESAIIFGLNGLKTSVKRRKNERL